MSSLAAAREAFGAVQLNARDFDGTEALTMHPSPNNMDVPKAYAVAVDAVFGAAALARFAEAGGLQNRTPREVVIAAADGAGEAEITELTGRLVEVKLKVLEREIGRHPNGQVWPQLSDGFAEFKMSLAAAKQQGAAVDDAVVSSGHTSFIQKVYDFWGLPYPDMYLTTETALEYIPPYTAQELTKPSAGLIRLAHQLWQQHRGITGVDFSPSEADHIVGVGDDDSKDGRMFRTSGVRRFHLIESATARAVWSAVSDDLGLRRFASGGDHARSQ